jgi:hypothetical protein
VVLVPESVSWLCRKQPATRSTRINATLRRMGHAAIDSPAGRGWTSVKAPWLDVFRRQYLLLTLLLVFAYFAHITSFYYILKWVAPIVTKMGFSPPTSRTCCSGPAWAVHPGGASSASSRCA